ncbi:hypothetical protein NQ318_016806 [Aromia moschata]|uniref:Uncharacterized protein n=1 Tax=Aromia moschata TaxID=1265417 RepID=A0AAV8YV66_9CUCU|nr:hypothetical protein NQ318_016806 [Aromia moschata]
MKRVFLIAIVALLCNVSVAVPPKTKASEAPPAPSNETLEQQLKDIGALLPKDLMQDIAQKHLKTDEEFKAAIKYMQGEEWVKLVETVRNKSEWIALKKFLKDSGIDMDVIINCVESFVINLNITLEPKEPPPKKSLKAFIIDVEQNIPTVKILAALHEKMTKGNAFQKLFERLSSQESRALVEKVIELPEVKRMMHILADMDVNLYDMFSLMYTFFGWGDFKH